MSLRKRVALVTGARGDIGQAICRALAAQGCEVIESDLSHEDAPAPPTHHRLQLDVTDERQWECAHREIARRHGRLDVLVNNAGRLTLGAIEHVSLTEWKSTIDVNLTGAFLGLKSMLPLLKSARGCVVNVSSVVALRGNRSMVAYVASKAGLVGLTQACALDHALDGIRINAVCPGTVEGAMSTAYFGADAGLRQGSLNKHPMGRLALPEEIGDAVAYLAGPQSSFITGVALPVDGGRLLG